MWRNRTIFIATGLFSNALSVEKLERHLNSAAAEGLTLVRTSRERKRWFFLFFRTIHVLIFESDAPGVPGGTLMLTGGRSTFEHLAQQGQAAFNSDSQLLMEDIRGLLTVLRPLGRPALLLGGTAVIAGAILMAWLLFAVAGGHPPSHQVVTQPLPGPSLNEAPPSRNLNPLSASQAVTSTSGYPPSGFTRLADDANASAQAADLHVEQWMKSPPGGIGGTLYQTWVVSRAATISRLPEIVLSDAFQGEDSGSIGYPSTFSFSPDLTYLCRTQKLAHGVCAAYLYRHVGGTDYQAAVPDLSLRVNEFFRRATGLQWEEGNGGIVEFSAWGPGNDVTLSLRGYSAGRKYAVSNWRCVFHVDSNQITAPAELHAANQNAGISQQPSAEPATVMPPRSSTTPPAALVGERYPQTRVRALTPEEIQGWSEAKARYAINEIYARRGATFRDKDLAKWFAAFGWYHPRAGVSYDDIEAGFSEAERQNVKLLGDYRKTQTAGPPTAAEAVAPTARTVSPSWVRPGTEEAANKDRADAELNGVYKQRMASLNPSQQKRLLAEELAWIKWRDTEAARVAHLSSVGGSAYRVDFLNALTDLIKKRTESLRSYRPDPGG